MNIKKRKESLKRRKAARQAQTVDENETEQTPNEPKKKFEQVFKDSDSELDSEDDYIPDQFKEEREPKNPMTVIREDEVMDFLDQNVVSQVTSVKESKKKFKNDFKTKDGRLILQSSDDEDENPVKEISEDYYKQSLASEVSFTRTADGRVKFLKRKRPDVGEDPTVGKRWNKSQSQNTNATEPQTQEISRMLGRQYKSKKAKGDVARKGMPDPHAFIPLTSKIVGNMKKSAKVDGSLKDIIKAAHTGSEVKGRQAKKVKGISKANKKHN